MQKQKKGFWLFIFSLIPGAGEMYMGFKKQGLSTMLLFWSIFAAGMSTGMDWIILFFPIVWFYSFFNVHNLKSLSEEEFHSVEDSYLLHLDEIIGDADTFIRKYRKMVAILLIVFGASILWNNLFESLAWILPERFNSFLLDFSRRLPQLVIAVTIILAGIYILMDRKHKLNSDEDTKEEEEHFLQPETSVQLIKHTTENTTESIAENATENTIKNTAENETKDTDKN